VIRIDKRRPRIGTGELGGERGQIPGGKKGNVRLISGLSSRADATFCERERVNTGIPKNGVEKQTVRGLEIC